MPCRCHLSLNSVTAVLHECSSFNEKYNHSGRTEDFLYGRGYARMAPSEWQCPHEMNSLRKILKLEDSKYFHLISRWWLDIFHSGWDGPWIYSYCQLDHLAPVLVDMWSKRLRSSSQLNLHYCQHPLDVIWGQDAFKSADADVLCSLTLENENEFSKDNTILEDCRTSNSRSHRPQSTLSPKQKDWMAFGG